MKLFASSLVVCCLLIVVRPSTASAQIFPGFDTQWSDIAEKVDDNHWRATGAVELWKGDAKFYADVADYYADTHRLIASGNVTVVQAESSISARAIDFNTETDTGTFYNGWGMASLGNRVDRSMFGTLEPDMYFYGETIEKIGARKYRITRGGFTTCVQPVPRWELTSGSVVISLEHYAVLTNSVLRVKGVPLFYLPILYYPVKTKEDRATGFLLPTYGTSSAHGFTLSNAFFWAMGRSQDLTVMHDWFSKTGQGLGEEYRYVRGPGRSGNIRFYVLNEHEYTTANGGGTTIVTPAKRSYKLDASASEMLNKYMRASGSVHYFTDVVSQQTYNMNIYDASRSSRTVSGNLSGGWHGYTFAGNFNRAEYFTGVSSSSRTGAEPRLNFSRGEQPIGNLPVYITLGGEYVSLRRGSSQTTTGDTPVTTVSSLGLSRVDFSPTIRVPFTKLSFLSVNSSVNWRGTYWSRSWDNPSSKNILDQSISRRLFEFTSTVTGPVVTRIFTPDNTYAEKIKHSIEPSVTVDYTTAVPEFDRIVQWETIDGIVGGTTRVTYGLTNRLFGKLKRDGQVQPSREILNVSLTQSYYSNARASQFDPQYSSSFTGAKPFNFSPIALVGRVTATDQVNATVRAEWDAQFGYLRTITAGTSYSAGNWLYTSGNWSLTRTGGGAGTASAFGVALARLLAEPAAAPVDSLRSLAFETGPSAVNHFLSGNANVRVAQNKYGANYSFNYDAAKKAFVQQRFTAYYNMQCCGVAVEYQAFNFGNLPGVPVPEDHRINFSFTLAGIGSFSNFFGALSGAPR